MMSLSHENDTKVTHTHHSACHACPYFFSFRQVFGKLINLTKYLELVPGNFVSCVEYSWQSQSVLRLWPSNPSCMLILTPQAGFNMGARSSLPSNRLRVTKLLIFITSIFFPYYAWECTAVHKRRFGGTSVPQLRRHQPRS